MNFESVTMIATGVSVVAWLYLILLRGGFWRCDEMLGTPVFRPWQAPDGGSLIPESEPTWRRVCAIIPARDEAATIAHTIRSVLGQRFDGELLVILVDDQSSDATQHIAINTASSLVGVGELIVERTAPKPPNWSGKLWALAHGASVARARMPYADYYWLTDADIEHGPTNLNEFVHFAESQDIDLVSQMVLLDTRGFWGRILIPAFIFFFQKLYPFSWVAQNNKRCAAAAGGSILIRPRALENAGGFAAFRDSIIDDCALAQRVKDTGGRLWVGLTWGARSLRSYRSLGAVWAMVRRSAYTQLGYSPVRLLGAVFGMVMIYLMPLVAIAVGIGTASWTLSVSGFMLWLAMALVYLPSIWHFGLATGLALTLPLAALIYTLMTLDSARCHWMGRGGEWKGRTAPIRVRSW